MMKIPKRLHQVNVPLFNKWVKDIFEHVPQTVGALVCDVSWIFRNLFKKNFMALLVYGVQLPLGYRVTITKQSNFYH